MVIGVNVFLLSRDGTKSVVGENVGKVKYFNIMSGKCTDKLCMIISIWYIV